MKTLKILLSASALSLACFAVQAQWALSGTNISNTNTGNVGVGIMKPVSKLHVQGGFLSSGASGTTPVSGSGTRLMWIPLTASLRAGSVSGTEWDHVNIGRYSIAFGQNNKASGAHSFAHGFGSTAGGDLSFAHGDGANASGARSIAMGFNSVASNDAAVAIGTGAKASGKNSTAVGHDALAQADNSFASGYLTQAIGPSSTAMGEKTIASGSYSFAAGGESQATGTYSFAAGNSAKAQGSGAIAMGEGILATADNSIALGGLAVASGYGSLALGLTVNAAGLHSKAIGHKVTAQADYSMAIGIGSLWYGPLVNTISKSLMIGFDSDLPTVFVGPSSGPGTFGFVGIGTTTPQSELAVNGTITAKALNLTLIGWPDYVFARGYNLRTLRETEQYIQAHQHLPGVPSAKEIEEKGLDVGTMSKIMMEKIEELTLHLINLEKENDNIRKSNADMKKDNAELRSAVNNLKANRHE